MKPSLKKKLKIIIPVAIVLALLAGAVLAYSMWKQTAKPAVTTQSGIATEEAPQYAACELITSQTIKDTFGGDRITQLREGERRAETAPNGTIAETCLFAFSTERSNSNTFAVAVYDYTATAENSDTEIIDESWSEVGGSSPVAYFKAGTESGGAVQTYTYRILPGGKNVTMTLRQPATAATYSQDEAFDFIGGIAAKANLEIIDTKIDGDVVDTTPGAITDTP